MWCREFSSREIVGKAEEHNLYQLGVKGGHVTGTEEQPRKNREKKLQNCEPED